MPALQPIELPFNDDPLRGSLKFEPVSVSNGLAVYSGEQFTENLASPLDPAVNITTSPVLAPTMTVSLQKPSKTSKISKCRLKIVIPKPVVEATVATKAKDREASVDITFMSSERASDFERYELIRYAISLLNSVLAEVIEGNKSIY